MQNFADIIDAFEKEHPDAAILYVAHRLRDKMVQFKNMIDERAYGEARSRNFSLRFAFGFFDTYYISTQSEAIEEASLIIMCGNLLHRAELVFGVLSRIDYPQYAKKFLAEKDAFQDDMGELETAFHLIAPNFCVDDIDLL